MRRRRSMLALAIALVIGALLIGSFVLAEVGIRAYSSHASSSSSGITDTTTSSGTSPAICSAGPTVVRERLNSTSFGSVTVFQLPSPLRGPNSITSAPDGSVWFGEVTLRGVAHLFTNGTLVEYPWPPGTFRPGMNCADLNELWGIALWKGGVWASDSANGQILGLSARNDSFKSIHLQNGSSPRFLAIDSRDNLWFTESATSVTRIGYVNATTDQVRYFDVPANQGEFSASLLFANSSVAYVVTTNPSNNEGQVFTFDPLLSTPDFRLASGNQSLLAPYSVALFDDGLWVSQHDASELAFKNTTTGDWTYYPTTINPQVALTLPYYLQVNGSELWFNEHDANRMAVICCGATSLTEYNMSQVSVTEKGIGNALTIDVAKNLAWFTEWTGNQVGFVNASIRPSFSIATANQTVRVVHPGGSTQIRLQVSGTSSSPLTLLFSDSESHTAKPVDLSFTANTSTPFGPLRGNKPITISINAASAAAPGNYIVLVTVTDGLTYRSLYLPVTVSR